MGATTAQSYLQPYLDAAAAHGGTFPSLLWASPATQKARFDAIRRSYDLHAKSVLDAGCGRADLLGFLLEKKVVPADYIGIEAVEELAATAERRAYANAKILRADFVKEPARLFVGADVLVFSGSLNTMQTNTFYAAIRRAYDAAAEAVVFNFLCSAALAARDYLVWHPADEVLTFCRSICPSVRTIRDYLKGDCTVTLIKDDAAQGAGHGR